MGLSRRQFTKEFKLAAVRRLEQGISMGEVARGMEVNPNVPHRWRKEFRAGPGNVFSGNWNQRWSGDEIAKLERKVGSPWNVLLSAKLTGLPKDPVASVSQIVSLDKDHLTERMGMIPRAKLNLIPGGIDLVLGGKKRSAPPSVIPLS